MLRPILILTLVCLLSSFILALVDSITAHRIEEQKRLYRLHSVEKALPKEYLKYDNDPTRDVLTVKEWLEQDGTPKQLFVARVRGKIIGYAFTSEAKGYGGTVKVMMGLKPDETIVNVVIIEHLETPGLGANIEKPELFTNQFIGKNIKDSQIGHLVLVKAESVTSIWEIKAITGATISSQAVLDAVNVGIANFRKYSQYLKGS